MHLIQFSWYLIGSLLKILRWINLTKDSSLLLMLFTVPSTRILTKTILASGFKNPYKKCAQQEYSSPFMNKFMTRNLD
jgi:hypothetical protein